MLYSMTGFGTFAVLLPTKKVNVDIKSLNSKQLDLNCRIPFALRSVEPAVRTAVASVVERGKLDLTLSVENIGTVTTSRFNTETICEYKAQIEQLAKETGLPLPNDWYAVLLRMPDTIVTADDYADPDALAELSQAVMKAIEGALDALMDYRRTEGRKLEEFFAVRIERIRKLLLEVPRYETERVERIKTRLVESLSKIPTVDYDKGRLEQEMIYYIEKLDVNEEKQRLAQHLDYFMETMTNDEVTGHGKKLGFIAQEMTREINTLGSKSNHAEMQNLVVRMKDELEQIKEQVLNVM